MLSPKSEIVPTINALLQYTKIYFFGYDAEKH